MSNYNETVLNKAKEALAGSWRGAIMQEKLANLAQETKERLDTACGRSQQAGNGPEQGQTLAPEHFLAFQAISQLRSSPAHTKGIFQVNRANYDENTYETALYLLEKNKIQLLRDFTMEKQAYFFEDEDHLLVCDNQKDPKDRDLAKEGLEFSSFYRWNLTRAGEATKAFTLPLAVQDIRPLHKHRDGLYLVAASLDRRCPEAWKLAEKERLELAKAKKYWSFREDIREIPFHVNGEGMIYQERTNLFIYDACQNKLRALLPYNYQLDSYWISDDGERVYFAAEEWTGKQSLYNRLFFYQVPEAEDLRKLGIDLWPQVKLLHGPSSLSFYKFWEADNQLYALVWSGKKYGINESTFLYRLRDYKVKDATASAHAASEAASQTAGAAELHDVPWEGPFPLDQVSTVEFSIGSSVNSDVRYGDTSSFIWVDGEVYYLTTTYSGTTLAKICKDGTIVTLKDTISSWDGLAYIDNTLYVVGLMGTKLPEIYTWQPSSPKKTGRAIEELTGENQFKSPLPELADAKALKEALNQEMSELTQVTNFNAKALAPFYVAQPQKVFYESKAGIEGYLLVPETYEKASPGESFPLILEVHGGPRTVYGPVYHHEMQCLVHEGYVVAFCNPRGSDGRGDAFADIRGDYGGVDFDDIMEFLDAVLAQNPKIDPERIGITGGSYGGFMTNWAIGHTDRFAAAVTQRSISNWLSFCGVSDIGFYFATDQNGIEMARTQADFTTLWDHSPLKAINEVKTPCLIIHADEDYRCPLEQGLQWFTGLQERQIPSDLCLFHGENHELSRSGKPKARLERLNRMIHWFDIYLKPETQYERIHLLQEGGRTEALKQGEDPVTLPAARKEGQDE